MKSAYLVGESMIKTVDEEFSYQLEANEVLVDIKSTTICASDIKHYIRGLKEDKGPVILGHEASGIISDIGPGVIGLNVGDRVSIEPQLYCGKCLQCRRGRTNICENQQFMARGGFPGSLVEKKIWPASKCHKIPEKMSYEAAALLEPMSIATNAIQKIDFSVTDTIAINGSGGIGMLGRIVINAIDPNVKVYMLDISDEKLNLCRQIGVENTEYINTSGKYELEPIDAIMELSGVPSAAMEVFRFLRPGGYFGAIGFNRKHEQLPIALEDIIFKSATIVGNGLFVDTWPYLLKLIPESERGIKFMEKVVSKTYDIDECDKAFKDCVNNRNHLKIAVNCNR